MYNILYAAANNENAKIQLFRFVKQIENLPFNLKIAAYTKSSPNINIDWNLDCLLYMFDPERLSLDNENFLVYLEQVKKFKPDLIISDLEYFTSSVANILNIPLWQCSSLIINFAIPPDKRHDVGLFKNYCELFRKDFTVNQRLSHLINISNKNFVYSHLGDLNNIFKLSDNFEWIRPYHQIAKPFEPCNHNIIAAMTRNNKKILNILNKYSDCVAFVDFCYENYNNIILKELNNYDEYFCNIFNSRLFICEGATSFLADAFYNKKYSIVLPNVFDRECIVNSVYSEHAGISKNIFSENENIDSYIGKEIDYQYNDKIKFLHEKLLEI